MMPVIGWNRSRHPFPALSSTTMPPKSTPSSAADSTAHAFNKLLNQPRPGSKSRNGEVDDGTKRLRRMILVEGIPSKAVRHPYSSLLGCDD